MRYLTFALAKGRLAEQTMDLLEKIGMPCEEMKEKTRKLIFTAVLAAIGYVLTPIFRIPGWAAPIPRWSSSLR